MIEYYEAFIDYFMSLDLSGQILTGILIIVGLIAVGYIIYGAIWIAYQSVKFSLVLTVIAVYLSIALISINLRNCFLLISGVVPNSRIALEICVEDTSLV